MFFKKKPKLAPSDGQTMPSSSQSPDKTKKQKNVTAKQATHDFINASKEFEKSRIGDIEKSRTIAWRVAVGACCVALMCALALVLITPLKEVRPYVIRVDNNTGATDIVTMLDGTEKSTQPEEVSKYFAAMYVRLVEGYDWYTIQKDVDNAMMFSDANIQNRLKNKFAVPSAPHKVLQEKARIEIKINNVSIIDEKGLIQVRFTSKEVPTDGGNFDANSQQMQPAPIEKKHIATIGFEYVNVPTVDEVRLINPLGFTVKSYRVDDDGI